MHTATGMDLMDLSVRMGNIVMIIGPGARMAESRIWETSLTVMLVSIGPSVNKSTVFISAYRADRSTIRRAEASVFPSFFS